MFYINCDDQQPLLNSRKDADTWGENYLQDLEKVEKIYLYLPISAKSSKVLFDCIRKQDLTNFRPFYQEAKTIEEECEDIRQSTCSIS